MAIILNKDKCLAIDGAFSALKENPNSIAPINTIKNILQDGFPEYSFTINMIENTGNDNLFFMSVFPEISTIDKIISAVMKNENTDTIKKLWESNKVWTIEIDSRILNSNYNFTDKELTAVLLHEIGHIVYSNAITTRISTIFRYEIAKSSMANKAVIRGEKIFRNIMALPIIDACVSDNRRDMKSIKEEIKADNFVKKIGYSKELESVLTKLIKSSQSSNYVSMDKKISELSQFSLKNIDDFRNRRDKIAKQSLFTIKEATDSSYIKGYLNNIINTIYEDSETSMSLHSGNKLSFMHEKVDDTINKEYITEFFNIGGKELKRIDPNDIDYIEIKVQSIKNESDKMMIVSFINSKIDLVDYYISILEDTKLAKKYLIPHTLQDLYNTKKRLMGLRESALKQKIAERNKDYLIMWPKGYEG